MAAACKGRPYQLRSPIMTVKRVLQYQCDLGLPIYLSGRPGYCTGRVSCTPVLHTLSMMYRLYRPVGPYSLLTPYHRRNLLQGQKFKDEMPVLKQQWNTTYVDPKNRLRELSLLPLHFHTTDTSKKLIRTLIPTHFFKLLKLYDKQELRQKIYIVIRRFVSRRILYIFQIGILCSCLFRSV